MPQQTGSGSIVNRRQAEREFYYRQLGGNFPLKKITQLQREYYIKFLSTNTGNILTAVVNSGGTGYTVGDILTVTGGSGANGQLRVTTAPGNVVSAVSIVNTGSHYVVTTGATTSGGSGTGATFDITVGFSGALGTMPLEQLELIWLKQYILSKGQTPPSASGSHPVGFLGSLWRQALVASGFGAQVSHSLNDNRFSFYLNN